MDFIIQKSKFDIWLKESEIEADFVEINALVELCGKKFKEIYFQLPHQWNSWITPLADPFLISFIFAAMEQGSNIKVHGQVSPSLLRNLEEFQAAWNRWKPKWYQKVEISADVEKENFYSPNNRALLAFSGGLDSSCSAWRHTHKKNGRRSQDIAAGVMVHGFDIPLNMPEVFQRAAARSKRMLDSIGVNFIPVVSNFRRLCKNWEYAHGAGIAAVLHLLNKNCSTGLIASSHVYERTCLPWGSNPVTDPLLSSNHFSIIYDSADLSRVEKAKMILDWKEALEGLRVCWIAEEKDQNCGKCITCVGTGACFAAIGAEIPESLNVSSLNQSIKKIPSWQLKPGVISQMIKVKNHAIKEKISSPWVHTLEKRIQQHNFFLFFKKWKRWLVATARPLTRKKT